jgi:hypothetical protein
VAGSITTVEVRDPCKITPTMWDWFRLTPTGAITPPRGKEDRFRDAPSARARIALRQRKKRHSGLPYPVDDMSPEGPRTPPSDVPWGCRGGRASAAPARAQ